MHMLQESLHRHCSQLASNPACQPIMHSGPVKSIAHCAVILSKDGLFATCLQLYFQAAAYACVARQSAQALAALLVSRSCPLPAGSGDLEHVLH